MRKKSSLLIFSFLTILIASPFILQTLNHEYTHIYFAKEHGCENITIHGPDINNFYNSSTASVTYNSSTCRDADFLAWKQEMVEAVGYQKTTQLTFYSIALVMLGAIWLKVTSIQKKFEKVTGKG